MEKISAELGVVRDFIEKEKESLKQSKMEEESCKEKVETYNIEIQVLQQKRDDVLKLKAEKEKSTRVHQAAIDLGEEQERSQEKRLGEVKLVVEKLEEEIATLPSAPGFNQDMLSLLNDQIATKRSELMCPVCFEESAPPIFSCTAQHLVCANCM